MTDVLLASSLAAAFAAGLVAFFAPCCAGVMMPAYLAAIGGGRRLRTARLTAIYIAGVATVVLPITLGAAALASSISAWHPQLFVLGGLTMIGVAVALWRGTMLPVDVPQPRLTGSTLSVYGLGVFSGAATACCAPVLVSAIALSATSGTIIGGLLLGTAYIAGMITPLVPLALLYGTAGRRVKDPTVTLAVAGHRKRIGVVRLSGVAISFVFGVVFIALALTGNSESAPGFQRAMGSFMRGVAARIDGVPNAVFLPLLIAAVSVFAIAILRRGGDTNERQEGEGSPTSRTPAGSAREG
jgi:cytochrome c biogenesis protein CcdA